MIAGGIVLVAALGLAAWLGWPGRPIKLDTPYQAVLLDNGQVFYGRLDKVDVDFLVLNDVYYIERQADAQTKEVKSVLVRRGNEWHAPNRSVINTRHVVAIEPVTPGSKVAELIAAWKSVGRN